MVEQSAVNRSVVGSSPTFGANFQMQIETIRNLLHAQPFRPFVLCMAEGTRIPIVHEDFIALQPAGRELTVYDRKKLHIINVMMITRIEQDEADVSKRAK
ncbi:MAG: hypothetical protein JWM99_3552 [Verrucomicrobiales bacterium]|nr:hypothetical protein [Verrucomicrobiales bacterium]